MGRAKGKASEAVPEMPRWTRRLPVTPLPVNRSLEWLGSMIAWRVGPEVVSRWSARSEARTNDLDAGEDRRMLKRSSRSLLSHLGVLRVDGELLVGVSGRSGLA